ncbi:MAG: MJ1255/VC2487 family glycosyltransferase [Pseudomonadota bacterium]
MTKILYGIQGTGNGHLTRARALIPELKAQGNDIDVIISGRDPKRLWDMDVFGDFRVFNGFTFAYYKNKISFVKSAMQSRLGQFYRDVKALNVEDYEVIISDFEPITAWAAKRRGRNCYGLSHQNAFAYDIPQVGFGPHVKFFMKNFAPNSHHIGFHWYHWNYPIAPPLIELPRPSEEIEDFFLVYLPHEVVDQVIQTLKVVNNVNFKFYAAVDTPRDLGHLHVKTFSRENFMSDLRRCRGVITNSGFTLCSEAIHLNKKLLSKPTANQAEQLSNALALEQLGLGMRTEQITADVISRWTEFESVSRIVFPNTAEGLAKWFKEGCEEPLESFCQRIWSEASIDLKTAIPT